MKKVKKDKNRHTDNGNLSASPTIKNPDVVFPITEEVPDLWQEAIDNPPLPTDALKTYLQHIGYYKRKKRKRCLSQELDELTNHCKAD